MTAQFSFPAGFVWGTATASYQVEGAAQEDGRGPSVWDTFCRTPGKVRDGHNGDVACDSYHRYEEDIRLMQALGVSAYRFSIAWPRVIPDGNGAVNQKGLDYYSRLVDALLRAGITPYATCYHWDMPEETYRKQGGWHARATAHDLARFAGVCSKALSDRVKHWFTVNELFCFCDISYKMGVHAPGEQVDQKALNQLTHHAVLGHGLAVDALRANASGPLQVGIAENPHCCVPVLETPEHITAARNAWHFTNGNKIIPILTGAYDPGWLTAQGADAPKIENGDLKQISRPLDFVAVNVYTGHFVRHSQGRGFEEVPPTPNYPLYNIFWMHHLPDSIYWCLRFTHELGAQALYISENGCCGSDQLTDKGEVLDVDRIQYLRDHLRATHRAVASGVPLKGYFLWSLLDNFEWAEGYHKRFGLHYVDFASQQRTQKLSAQWYAQVTRANRVL